MTPVEYKPGCRNPVAGQPQFSAPKRSKDKLKSAKKAIDKSPKYEK